MECFDSAVTVRKDELAELLRKSAERVKQMTPEELAEMMRAQRESWVRANMPTGDPRWD